MFLRLRGEDKVLIKEPRLAWKLQWSSCLSLYMLGFRCERAGAVSGILELFWPLRSLEGQGFLSLSPVTLRSCLVSEQLETKALFLLNCCL